MANVLLRNRQASRSKIVQAAVFMGVVLLAASTAHATNSALPWESGLTVFSKSITGPVAGIISLLAICVCGGMLAMGAELNDIAKKAAQVVLSIGVCVGAASVISVFTNNNATTNGAEISMVAR